MKYIDEFRDPVTAARYVRQIARITTRNWTIMEVCGGQTHAILKSGIDQLLPKKIELLHGPGCPVCVTPVELVDMAVAISSRPNVIFCSFGDMMRVPGSSKDLLSVRAEGGDIRTVYAPTDTIKIARDNPGKEVVFFGIGFETTAPANASLVYQARQLNLKNLSILMAQVLIPPAMEAILGAPGNNVQGFLAAGHVCSVVGFEDYEKIVSRYRIPIVVTGFEPIDILQGIYMTIAQLEEGRAEVENQYRRAVRREGNLEAKKIIGEVFTVVDRKWRGLGIIKKSGLALCEKYLEFDAAKRFGLEDMCAEESAECISGLILQGKKKPFECSVFGTKCTPEHPLGATMVSSEGACAAYYRYRKAGPESMGHQLG
ncbi:MAG: hydrogenase formation protein HypD [candidate division Zixibacteria bacterium HGW-Zixibacteria-1]|nr:MAG: hydrogenase formation protein HypD [candidate division Zixibacteria bacterium HGW-Zixibacteria-1]